MSYINRDSSGVESTRLTLPMGYFDKLNTTGKARSHSILGLKNNNSDLCLTD